MATSYSAIATKLEGSIICTALDAGDFPEKYAEKVEGIVGGIKDNSLKERVRQTLGCFEKGSAGNLIQSSPCRLVVLQQLLPQGKKLATIPRLKIAKENDPNFMAGFYVDGGLNLVPYNREDEAINAVQAGKLEVDLREAGVNTREARLIPYHILIPHVDEKSPSGLVFRLSKEGKDVVKDVIRKTADFKWDYESTQGGGLFRAFLLNDGNWYCVSRNLAGSNRSGGVVVESAEGTSPKNLQGIIKRRNSAREKYFAELIYIRDEIDREIKMQ